MKKYDISSNNVAVQPITLTLNNEIDNYMANCIFCELLANAETDPTFIIKLRYGTLFVNRNQHYQGRCLHILNQHHENFHAVDDELFMGFNHEIKMIGKVLHDLFAPDLINYALLGNHIQHVHWHIIPRYKNDSNWGNPPWPYPHSEDVHNDSASVLSAKIKQRLIREYGAELFKV